MEKKKKTWGGSPPSKCDLCDKPIVDEFVDGRTIHGGWAIMCFDCFKAYGVGIKTGYGQAYLRDGEVWEKIPMNLTVV